MTNFYRNIYETINETIEYNNYFYSKIDGTFKLCAKYENKESKYIFIEKTIFKDINDEGGETFRIYLEERDIEDLITLLKDFKDFVEEKNNDTT